MVILHIDTSSNKEISVGLEIDGENDMIIRKTDAWKAQIILPLINELLEKHEITIHDVSQIKVNEGPGSFTGLRVGVAIANTLGSWLKIPVNGKPVGEIVEPKYI